ncbi:MAG: hypothetical protein ACP5OA_01040 [Candidatus Woesearchaeota archaeon]
MKYHTKLYVGIIAIALLFLSTLTLLPKAIAPNIAGQNYQNVTVHTHVNITHSKPDVLNVTVHDASNFSINDITINAGSTKKVSCNATVRSWEGFNDISRVNATLWHLASSVNNASDNNNSHYTNGSCTTNGSLGAFTGWYTCDFDVLYYSNNGTWICNVTVSNSHTQINPNFTGSGYNTTTFYPVYALNVTDGIDYGNVAVEDYSAPDRTANITNFGNMGINITVEGYGVTRGDGLAMNCSLSGNIAVENERFAVTSGQAYGTKTQLTSTSGGVMIPTLVMPKQTVPGTQIINATYWQLYIPPNPAGNCTGFIIFTAISS